MEKLSFDQLRTVRQRIQMVFQDRDDLLNPRRTAGETVLEPLGRRSTDLRRGTPLSNEPLRFSSGWA